MPQVRPKMIITVELILSKSKKIETIYTDKQVEITPNATRSRSLVVIYLTTSLYRPKIEKIVTPIRGAKIVTGPIGSIYVCSGVEYLRRKLVCTPKVIAQKSTDNMMSLLRNP